MSIKKQQKYRIVIFLSSLVFTAIGTYLAIKWAKGYRPTRSGTIKGTGLLVANSFPKGAQVYINNKLTTATDDTINLPPDKYHIEIKKDGMHTWSKDIVIKKELVTQTNATLFPTVPSLQPLTFTGAINPTPSPDGNKIVFAVASSSATLKNGLYVQELSSNPIFLNKSAKQIARNTQEYDFSQATYTWSPDSSEIIVTFPNQTNIILDTNKLNNTSEFKDITYKLPSILKEWEYEIAQTEQSKLKKLPEFMLKVATTSAKNIFMSPDGEKMLYQATKTVTIPDELIPPLPATNTQQQSRTIEPNNFYIYDLKEDKNFLILSNPTTQTTFKELILNNILDPISSKTINSTNSAIKPITENKPIPDALNSIKAQYSSIYVSNIQWFPDSYHLIITTDKSIDIVEYDGTNRTTIYSGPFNPSLVYPWPDGSKIVTLIKFSPETPQNLYAIKLK